MRIRFSIRDLLWLTALVAVLVAWWVDHRRYESIGIWEIEQSHGTTIITNLYTKEQFTLTEGSKTVTGRPMLMHK
jgi:hypothetical protein